VREYPYRIAGPENTPWGNQVQDGGAVLAFSYHDLMARLKEVSKWFGEVTAAGGYRAFYASKPGGATLQGGGPPGGLGMDNELKESVLVPQVMLDGFSLAPKLPRDWAELSIDRIGWHDRVLWVRASRDWIEISAQPLPGVAQSDGICWISLPIGKWRVTTLGVNPQNRGDGALGVRWSQVSRLRLERKPSIEKRVIAR